MRSHNSINNESSSKRRRLAIALGVATIASFGAYTLSSEGKPAENNRYPAPAAADTLRLQHIAEPGNPDEVQSKIAEKIAADYNNTSGVTGHLTTQEVEDHMYSAGGTTPEGQQIPAGGDTTVSPNEHFVVDIPVKKVFDK